jgi:gamma-glutamyltranspeptidase/glutathione hydrolase
MFSEIPYAGLKPVATGKQAMASTQHPAVTKAILKVMRDGGNAVDATITGTLLQCVVQPHMTTLQGIIDFMYYEESTGCTYCMTAMGELPEGLPPFAPNPTPYAPNSVCGIPGIMPGLGALAKRFGTKPWSYYVQPALEVAEKGHVMTSMEYGYLNDMYFTLSYFPSTREFFFPNGFFVPVGEVWKMPHMAETLRNLAKEGPEYFTKGTWAKHFVEMGNEIGWKVTMGHMAAYEPRWVEPLRFTFRGHEMLGISPPEMGGLVTAYFLGVLEDFDLKKMGHYTESAETLALMARIFYRQRQEQDYLLQDPLSFKVPTKVFMSKEYHRLVAQILRESEPIVDLTENVKLKAGVAAMIASGLQKISSAEVDSCHNCVVDPKGNWVTMLHSLPSGIPGLVVDGIPGYGMPFDAVCVGPGRRSRVAINPILVMRDGHPWMTLGSPGDISHNVPTVLANILGFDMEPYAAIDAPRFRPTNHPTSPFMYEKWTDVSHLEVENRLSDKVLRGLAKLGFKVKPLGVYNWHSGSIQCIWRDDKTRMLKGATDPRREGHAEGF